MEEIRLVSQGKEGGKASLKSALLRYFRSPRFHQKNKSKNNVLMKAHTIARVNGINVISQSTQEDNEIVRMNILVREEDLEQILEHIRNTNTTTTTTANNNDKNNSTDNGVDDYEEVSATLSIEERLNLLRKKLKRQNTWSPALQTIPEEISPN